MAQRLSSEERARIEVMIAAGVSVAEMAWRLGRDPSTIHREIKRNSTPAGYDADLAEVAAQSRVMRPKPARLVSEPALAASVAELLDTGWSPHAISAGLRSEGLVVCAETIYRACYDHTGSRGLPEGSWQCLPRRRRRRKQRGRCTRKPSPLGVFKPIADRPAAASGRSEAGHWEGDLIIGKGNRSAVVTLTERVSRQTLLAELPHGHDAQSTAAAVVAALRRQPEHLVKTPAWDQGREMARWADVEAALDMNVFFCEPRSPWQRPTNEQTNGLLRRWLRKGTDINVGQVRLAVIEDWLNTMPRKLHGWESSHSVYTALTCVHR